MPQKPQSSTQGEIRAALDRAAIFSGVEERTLRKIARIARWQRVDEGDVLYEMGDPVRSLYVVAAGRLRFALGGGHRIEGGGSVILPGDVLGWAALVADLPRRIATVVALDPCALLELERLALLRLLEEDARAGYLVMQRLAKMITESFLEQSHRLGTS